MKILICGGGVAGLAAGHALSKQNHKITIIEKKKNVGGLAGCFNRDGESIPYAPHQCFKFDKYFLSLVEEFTKDKMVWLNSKMGIADMSVGKLWGLTSSTDLLKFNYLPLLDRMRLAFFSTKMLLKNTLHMEESLDGIDAEYWFRKKVGDVLTDKLITPMVRMKFGISLKDASLSYLVRRIWCQNISGRGVYGYPSNGIQPIWENMAHAIRKKDGEIVVDARMVDLEIKNGKVVSASYESVNKRRIQIRPDVVINTMPIPEFMSVSRGLPELYLNQLQRYRYTRYIGFIFKLRQSLSQYLITLFLNSDFGGMNEFSHFTQGQEALVYLFKYLKDDSDSFWHLSDSQLYDLASAEMKRVFPHFDVIWWKIVRTQHSAVLHDIDYYRYKVDYRTPIPNLFHSGMHVIYPDDRIMDNSIKSGYDVAKLV